MATTREDLGTSATGPERRLAPPQIALAVLAALLLLIGIWFLFLRSSDGGEELAAPVDPVPVATPEEEEQAPPTRRGPVETFEVFAPKDPFDPLISASTQSAGTSGTTTAGTTSAGSGTSSSIGTGNGTTTTTTTGENGGDEVGGHRVRVIDVYRDGGQNRAQIQVDGTVYTVDEGERFAENFQLISTSGQCATMLYGDDEFTLCEGEEILK